MDDSGSKASVARSTIIDDFFFFCMDSQLIGGGSASQRHRNAAFLTAWTGSSRGAAFAA